MYFCTKIQTNVKFFGIIILIAALCLASCRDRRQETVTAPWGEVISEEEVDTTAFDLDDIERSGELIALTLSGPQTCYDYHGRQLGLHAMLCQKLAQHMGVRLRLEVCRDTTDMLRRIDAGEADLIAFPLSPDSLWPGWAVDSSKPQLAETIRKWYQPAMLAETSREEQSLLKGGGVKRRVFAPMLNREGGIISRYDGLFQQHSRIVGWDWRLMAAQCYQESTFDPDATSWAGARGLMQIMPQTADHLGLARADLSKPDRNIEAAARYLKELDHLFSDIHERRERQDFVLAAYNGGHHHIRDAMALCQRDGGNPHRWRDVAHYVLRLSDPRYYQDPLVQNGYMRGVETVDYVDKIRQRWQQYRGVKRNGAPSSGTPQKSRNEKHKKKYQIALPATPPES